MQRFMMFTDREFDILYDAVNDHEEPEPGREYRALADELEDEKIRRIQLARDARTRKGASLAK